MCVCACAYAYTIILPTEGAAGIEVNGDTLIFFRDEPQLSFAYPVDWYDHSTGILKQGNSDSYYPEDGLTVRISHIDANDTIGVYTVYDYSHHKPVLDKPAFTLFCDRTEMILSADSNTVPSYNYLNRDGRNRSFAFPLRISMRNLVFGESGWEDSLRTVEDHMKDPAWSYTLPPLYLEAEAGQTVTIVYDTIAQLLGLDPMEAQSSKDINLDPIAVGYKPLGYINKRGKEGDKTNEIDRPLSDSLPETNYQVSAPLDVQFRANPTPAAQYFLWRIYKGSQLITQRVDENHRFEFIDPGVYKVVCYAGNNHCPCEGGVYIMDCEFRDSIIVSTFTVTSSRLAVPNVFTPDGNGTNDEFRVLYRSLATFKCEVYNRWGKRVFTWTDPSKGWDGTIGGRPAAEGAYFYVIRAIGTDGIEYKLSGDINLLREHKD